MSSASAAPPGCSSAASLTTAPSPRQRLTGGAAHSAASPAKPTEPTLEARGSTSSPIRRGYDQRRTSLKCCPRSPPNCEARDCSPSAREYQAGSTSTPSTDQPGAPHACTSPSPPPRERS